MMHLLFSQIPYNLRQFYELSQSGKYIMILPLKSGTAFHTDIGPSEANCPIDNSIKNMGRPHVIRNITYGIRKLAENYHLD